MKICPKCNKPNPDNSKKCFYCQEDLTEILPFVPEEEPEIQDPIEEEDTDDLEDEDFEEEVVQEEQEIPKEPKKPKFKIEIKPWTPKETVQKLFPVSAVIIFILTVFLTVCLITDYYMEENLMKGIIFGGIIFITGTLFSLVLLWMNAVIFSFSKDKSDKQEEEEDITDDIQNNFNESEIIEENQEN